MRPWVGREGSDEKARLRREGSADTKAETRRPSPRRPSPEGGFCILTMCSESFRFLQGCRPNRTCFGRDDQGGWWIIHPHEALHSISLAPGRGVRSGECFIILHFSLHLFPKSTTSNVMENPFYYHLSQKQGGDQRNQQPINPSCTVRPGPLSPIPTATSPLLELQRPPSNCEVLLSHLALTPRTRTQSRVPSSYAVRATASNSVINVFEPTRPSVTTKASVVVADPQF